jgi:hypothetical protein
MSAVIEKFIICDSCGINYGVDNRQLSIAQHRKDAKAEGWAVNRDRGCTDVCPSCITKTKKHEDTHAL